MLQLMYVFGAISRVLRVALFGVAVVTFVLSLAAWAVRSRRINPFSGLARAIRTITDPLLAPVEKRLLLGGQRVSNSPWWLLGIVIVGGLLLIAAFDFITAQVLTAANAATAGPRGILVLVVVWTFAILRLALLVRVLSSWIRISPMNPVIRLSFRLTEWMLAPLRGVIPTLGMFDITPIIAYFLLGLIERVVVGAL